MLELRTYTLASRDALRAYIADFWPRHARSLLGFSIVVRAVWADDAARQVLALVEYPGTEDPTERADRYRRSSDFDADHAHFDATLITSTHTRRLEPVLVGSTDGSPHQRAGRYSR